MTRRLIASFLASALGASPAWAQTLSAGTSFSAPPPSVVPPAPLALPSGFAFSALPTGLGPSLTSDLLPAPLAVPGLGALPEAPGPVREEPELFSGVGREGPTRSRKVFWASAGVHAAVVAAVLLSPLFLPATPPPETDYVKVLIYNPPPPPPLPLPKGSLKAKGEKKPVVKPETVPEKKPEVERPKIVESPKEEPKPAEPTKEEAFGSEKGHEKGVPEGLEGGVPEGQVGGVPGGVVGGVIGGTGDVVLDYDRAPRPIKITQPRYPTDAFQKKIQGTVLLEIVIDSTGRVVRARVVQSVPSLDQAALETVRQWVFEPAVKNGRAVATTAQAPVTFRIY